MTRALHLFIFGAIRLSSAKLAREIDAPKLERNVAREPGLWPIYDSGLPSRRRRRRSMARWNDESELERRRDTMMMGQTEAIIPTLECIGVPAGTRITLPPG